MCANDMSIYTSNQYVFNQDIPLNHDHMRKCCYINTTDNCFSNELSNCQYSLDHEESKEFPEKHPFH